MKRKTFYQLLLKGQKEQGVLFAPKDTLYGFGTEVKPVIGWRNITFKLKRGEYFPFMNSNVGANFANEELKDLIEENIPSDYPLEFFPIQIKSEEYGDKIYYLIHFTTVFDVIDNANSVWVVKSIAKPWIDYEKAKDLDFFNSTARTNSIIVSDKFRKLMKKKNLDKGIEFLKVPCVE